MAARQDTWSKKKILEKILLYLSSVALRGAWLFAGMLSSGIMLVVGANVMIFHFFQYGIPHIVNICNCDLNEKRKLLCIKQCFKHILQT